MNALVRELSPRILVAIRKYARHDHHAQDLLQDCWVHIFKQLDRFSGDTPFEGWAIVTSRNLCASKLRHEERKGIKTVPLRANTEDVAEGSVALKEQRRNALYAGLARLSDRERDALVLRVIEGRSAAETAERLDVSKAGVRAIIQRGITKLRRTEEVRALLAVWKGLR